MIIRPKTSMIRSLASASMGWKVALTELIDNSLDAGAMTVDVSIVPIGKGKRMFRIVDDGCGSDSMEPFFTFGSHEEHASVGRGSGTYGFGGTAAVLWIGGAESKFSVDTTHDGVNRFVSVDWASVEGDEWKVDDPSVREMPVGTPNGTTICVLPIDRQVPGDDAWDRIVSDLAIIYSPAIRKRGVQIKVRRDSQEATVLKAFTLPEFDGEVIGGRVEVGGKWLTVRAGIVKDGVENPLPGLTWGHRYRALSELVSHSLGCGSAPIGRICGWVQLDDSWERFLNKQGFKGSKRAGEKVAEFIKPLLMRAEVEGEELESAAFAAEVESAVNAGIANASGARARRPGRGGKKGSQRATGTGPKHRNARVKQANGPMPWSESPMRVVWQSLGDNGGAGRVDNRIVTLNIDCPLVRDAREEKNALATKAIADSLIAASYAIHGKRSLRFSFAVDEDEKARQFDLIFGRLLSSSRSAERPTLAEAAE